MGCREDGAHEGLRSRRQGDMHALSGTQEGREGREGWEGEVDEKGGGDGREGDVQGRK